MTVNPTSRVFGALGAAAFMFIGCGKDEPILLAPVADAAAGPAAFEKPTKSGAGDEQPSPPNTSPPVASGPSVIGKSCEKDGDCDAAGVTCMRATGTDWSGGGPAHGYCSADCAANLDGEPDLCRALDGNSACLTRNDGSFCVALCELGRPPDGIVKCQNRADLACDAVAADGGAFCRPMCRSNADCGGRLCDFGKGVCVDELPDGDPIGSKCDPDAASSTCASGVCESLGEGFGVCSGYCNLSTVGCGSSAFEPADDPGEPICIYPAAASGSGLSDLGECLQRCNCDEDCLHPDALCYQLDKTEAVSREILGTIGVCVGPGVQDDTPEDQKTPLGFSCVSAAGDGGMTRLDSGKAVADSGPGSGGQDGGKDGG